MKIKLAEILCMTNIFNVKHFMATKIRLRENFTSEIFYWRKYTYVCILYNTRAFHIVKVCVFTLVCVELHVYGPHR